MPQIFIDGKKGASMSKIAFKSIYLLVLGLAMMVSMALSAGAVDDADVVYDVVELKNGEKVTGTLLNDTFTVTTPYSSVTLEKDKISEININPESVNHDVIVLNVGGSLDGTIEEPSLSFKLVSGKIISLGKEQCKKITLKQKNE
jgi:hypothetical protein